MTPISFHQQTKVNLAERNRLKAFIDKLLKKHKKQFDSLTYIFCTDEYLLGMNKQFLKHDYYTDILTFDLSEPGLPGEAEIYISIDRVKDNAKSLEVSMQKELHRVIFHGALHLCSYKDKTKKDKLAMTAAEDECLKLYFS